jgi:hypothetical protein
MSGEASEQRVSRAAVIRTAAIGAVGAAGVMLADEPAAEATTVDSDYIATNNGSSDLPTAYICTTGSGGHGYDTGGQFAGTSAGVYASSSSGNGLIGTSGGAAGDLGAAVRAFTTGNGDGVWASAGTDSGVGVHGENFADGDGVYGVSDGVGAGVHGVGNGGSAVYAEDASEGNTGTGLLATSRSGTALRVSGRAAYSNCGVATIAGTVASPKQAVAFKGAQLTANSVVIATLQANIAGVFVASAVPHVAAGTVTINLNQAVTQHVKVGWFVCDLIPVPPV